jgi:glycosyltransferase involved in cell wall biosynthesis
MNSKQNWLWIHDVHCFNKLTPEVAQNLHVIVALSKWHAGHLKRCYPFLKDCEVLDFTAEPTTYTDDWTAGVFYEGTTVRNKPVIAIIRDGITASRYQNSTITKQLHRFIWSSSADRGLEELLTLWPNIRTLWPDAELHIFYGWVYWDAWFRGRNPPMMAYKEKLIEMGKQPGVFWEGRVGQSRMAEEWLKSDIWLYPPHQFRETCCISAIEAQASKVACVYRQNGALGETVGNRGIPLPLTASPDDILKALEQTSTIDREAAYRWAVKQDWSTIAKSAITLYHEIERRRGDGKEV